MDKRLFIAGHRGLVGSALVRRYQREPGWTLILRPREELDLTDTSAVESFFRDERPTHVIDAAGKVGGIQANQSQPVEFLLDNLRIQNNIISACHRHGIAKLLFLGSSCIYPKRAPQPIPESALLSGPLEKTNDAYAIAKIAGIMLCQAYRRQHGCSFISAMPTNLYGPNDNFSLETSHVLPALLRKFHDAKTEGRPSVTLWGTGSPRREFLHVDDLADACALLMEKYDSEEIINVGSGRDLTIRELAMLVAHVVGFAGDIVWDATRPDGTPRKLLDVARIQALGWSPRVGLAAGIRATYDWFLGTAADPRPPE